jgi:hypothetical protein
MTKTETAQILAILKAAYPNSYKNLTTEDANATVNVWAAQFANMPASVVMIAVNKLISTNIFPPTITEVKEKMRGLYWEAQEMITLHNRGLRPLNEKTLATTKAIIKVVEPMRTVEQIEPSMYELLDGYAQYLTDGKNRLSKYPIG